MEAALSSDILDDLRFLAYMRRVESTNKDGDGRHVPYKDSAGHWTIGYGRKIAEKGDPVPREYLNGIDEAKAEEFLRKDLASARDGVAASLGATEWGSYSARQQQMLVDFAYNLGPRLGAKAGSVGYPKMREALRSGDVEGALRESKRYGEFSDAPRNKAGRRMGELVDRNIQTAKFFFGRDFERVGKEYETREVPKQRSRPDYRTERTEDIDLSGPLEGLDLSATRTESEDLTGEEREQFAAIIAGLEVE